MADEKYDGLLLGIARDHSGIEPLLDSFFSFLRRKTDFFTGAPEATVHTAIRAAVDRQFAKVPKHLRKSAAPEPAKQAQPSAKAAAPVKPAGSSSVTIEPVDDDDSSAAEAAAEAKKRKEEAAARARDELERGKKEQEAARLRDEREREERAAEGKSGDGGGGDEEEDDPDAGKPSPNTMNGGTTDKYVWGQTLAEAEVRVPLPAGTRAKQLDVSIKAKHIRVAIKGGDVLMDGDLSEAIKADESMWAIEDGSILSLSLVKVNGMNWWANVLTDEPEIATRKIVPENSKLEDLDASTRQTVEKMMFDQRAKAAGLPTSEERQKQEMLKKFMDAHPEMDFSNAKIQ